MIGNDFVIKESYCNLSCSYCLTGQSSFMKKHSGAVFQPPKRLVYSSGSELKYNMDTVAERTRDFFGLALLKITGGEALLVDGIMDFVSAESPKYRTVVLQTNAVLLTDEIIEKLCSLKNVVLQVSLDSHVFEGNSYRAASPDVHRYVMERFNRAAASGLSMEVSAVLTDRSIPFIPDFASYLTQLDGDVFLVPFPVRGPWRERFFPEVAQAVWIERLLNRYDALERVLPPRAYLERLSWFISTGSRTHRCFLPALFFSSFDDGLLTPCPNIWFAEIGNVLTDDYEQALSRLGKMPFYQLLLAPRPRLEACKGCFTPWDLLTLYCLDEITIDELGRSPGFRDPYILKRLLLYKQEVENSALAGCEKNL